MLACEACHDILMENHDSVDDIHKFSAILFINASYLSTIVPCHQHAHISFNIFCLIVANLGRMLMLIILEMLLMSLTYAFADCDGVVWKLIVLVSHSW